VGVVSVVGVNEGEDLGGEVISREEVAEP